MSWLARDIFTVFIYLFVYMKGHDDLALRPFPIGLPSSMYSHQLRAISQTPVDCAKSNYAGVVNTSKKVAVKVGIVRHMKEIEEEPSAREGCDVVNNMLRPPLTSVLDLIGG